MSMPLGLHGATIPQANLNQGIQEAASAGFNAYEPEVGRVEVCTPAQIDEANAARKRLGLTFLPLNELEVFGGLTMERARQIFGMAKSLSITACTVIPAVVPAVSMDAGVAELSGFAKEAKSHGISLYFEMLCFANRPFHTFEDSLRLAEKCGIKLVIDTFHYIVSGATLKQVADLPKDMIGIVHITDSIVAGKKYSELLDADRVLPGEGHLPMREYMEAIRQTGYAGGMSVEVFHPKYGKTPVAEVAADAHRRAVSLLKDSGWIKG
jgi:2-keto-myo-inositol isomerase